MKWFVSVLALGVLLQATVTAATNVVLLSVDTLRADRLGCYGYAHDTSPNLDAFAEGALVFENAMCEVPLTCPSFTAMLTSRYPRSTGVTRNGLGLGPGDTTVVERFAAAGYDTFCVQSNWTLKANLSGLDRGFARYDDHFRGRRWGIIKGERDGEEVTRLALEWLEQRDPQRPFFAWIHYSDPHAPYEMHRGFNPQGRSPWRFKKRDRVRVRYDSEVAFTDAQIQRVLEALPSDTAVLFLSDHGESLFEHGYLGHGRRIYQTCLHIPFMIRAPGLAPGRSTAPVRGLDVAPTLLGLAGLEPGDGMEGLNLVREAPAPDRVRVVETYGGAVPNLPGAQSLMADAPPMRQGAIVGNWKLILGGSRPQLYNIESDPGEQRNLAKSEPETLAMLKQAIAEWDAGIAQVRQRHQALSAEDVEALESLGYIE